MISKQQFIESLLKDIRILKTLSTKIKPGTLDYRPTPKQRSTLELLQYLSLSSTVALEGIKKGKVENYQESMRPSLLMKQEEFPARMDEQMKSIQTIINGLTDQELEEEIDLFGMGFKFSRKAWLLELVQKSLVGYKMQLFLYIKASGNPDIGTRDLWME